MITSCLVGTFSQSNLHSLQSDLYLLVQKGLSVRRGIKSGYISYPKTQQWFNWICTMNPQDYLLNYQFFHPPPPRHINQQTRQPAHRREGAPVSHRPLMRTGGPSLCVTGLVEPAMSFASLVPKPYGVTGRFYAPGWQSWVTLLRQPSGRLT